jgi:hypothetical protein
MYRSSCDFFFSFHSRHPSDPTAATGLFFGRIWVWILEFTLSSLAVASLAECHQEQAMILRTMTSNIISDVDDGNNDRVRKQ